MTLFGRINLSQYWQNDRCSSKVVGIYQNRRTVKEQSKYLMIIIQGRCSGAQQRKSPMRKLSLLIFANHIQVCY